MLGYHHQILFRAAMPWWGFVLAFAVISLGIAVGIAAVAGVSLT